MITTSPTDVHGMTPARPGAARIALSVMALLLTLAIAGGLARSARPAGGRARATSTGRRTAADAEHRQYSSSAASRRENVGQLRVAWTYHTGDARPRSHADPVQSHRRPRHALRHVAAAEGASRSTPRPGASAGSSIPSPAIRKAQHRSASTAASSTGRTRRRAGAHPVHRGPAALRARRRDRPADRGLRHEGQRRSARGLRPRREQALRAVATRRASIYRDLLILGIEPRRGPGPGGARRHSRLRRAHRHDPLDFHTIPHPGRARLRHLAAGRLEARRRRQRVERHQRRRARAAWSSCRPDRRPSTSGAATVTARTSSPTRCSRSTRATGKRVWHFQFVHHDLWDRDLPRPPVLVTVHARRHAASTRSRRSTKSRLRLRLRSRDRRRRSSRSRSGRCRAPTSTASRRGRRSRCR